MSKRQAERPSGSHSDSDPGEDESKTRGTKRRNPESGPSNSDPEEQETTKRGTKRLKVFNTKSGQRGSHLGPGGSNSGPGCSHAGPSGSHSGPEKDHLKKGKKLLKSLYGKLMLSDWENSKRVTFFDVLYRNLVHDVEITEMAETVQKKLKIESRDNLIRRLKRLKSTFIAVVMITTNPDYGPLRDFLNEKVTKEDKFEFLIEGIPRKSITEIVRIEQVLKNIDEQKQKLILKKEEEVASARAAFKRFTESNCI